MRSGAGSTSKVNRVEDMPSLMMALAKPGYMRLDAHADGSLDLTVLALEKGERREVFRHCLAEGPPAGARHSAARGSKGSWWRCRYTRVDHGVTHGSTIDTTPPGRTQPDASRRKRAGSRM